MSSRRLAIGSSAAISSACAWWPIIPCMNRTSAAVNCTRDRSVAFSARNRRDSPRPGAPGWTIWGLPSTLRPCGRRPRKLQAPRRRSSGSQRRFAGLPSSRLQEYNEAGFGPAEPRPWASYGPRRAKGKQENGRTGGASLVFSANYSTASAPSARTTRCPQQLNSRSPLLLWVLGSRRRPNVVSTAPRAKTNRRTGEREKQAWFSGRTIRPPRPHPRVLPLPTTTELPFSPSPVGLGQPLSIERSFNGPALFHGVLDDLLPGRARAVDVSVDNRSMLAVSTGV